MSDTDAPGWLPSIPGYELRREIGRGGFAVVYEAVQLSIDRPVAIKVVNLAAVSAEVTRRFRTECTTIGRLSWHPHVVAVHDAGQTAEGLPFLAMELLPGGSFADRVKVGGPLSPEGVAAVGAQIAGALAVAHAEGVVHRDIKPENVMIGRLGEALLADFGIATLEDATRSASGSFTGTVIYSAPEVLKGQRADARADVYSLGATLHALAAGRAPFAGGPGDSPYAAIWRVTSEDPASLPAHIPATLAQAIAQAMAKDPANRYPTAQAFQDALVAAVATSPGPSAMPSSSALVVPPAPTSDAEITRAPASPPAETGGPISALPTRAEPTNPAVEDGLFAESSFGATSPSVADKPTPSLGGPDTAAPPATDETLAVSSDDTGPRSQVNHNLPEQRVGALTQEREPGQTLFSPERAESASPAAMAPAARTRRSNTDPGTDPLQSSMTAVAPAAGSREIAAPARARTARRRGLVAIGGGVAVVLAISVAVVILTSETRTDKPDLVPFANITQITAGWQHSCALTRDGAVHCWGWNGKGQLGDDSTNDSTTPVQVHNLTDITQVTAGGDHTCALTRDGTAHCWGDNTTSADSEVAARARERGQLGDGTTDASLTPVKVRDLTDITQITAGEDHTCALTQDGTAHCWGANHDGQLGTGSTDDSLVAVRVQGLTDVIQLSAGSNHTCALTQDGTAQCWGNNFHGQLGSGTTSGSTPVTTPVPVRDLAGIAQVTAGDRQTCALLHDGTARCWGWNDWGQLGNGSSNTSSTPVQVRDLTDISQITAGLDATCAVTQGGAAHCWGRNALGDEAEVKSPTPVRVRALTGVTQIVSSVNHVCSLAENGTALCWGFNGGGRLGNGTNANSSIPVQVVVPES